MKKMSIPVFNGVPREMNEGGAATQAKGRRSVQLSHLRSIRLHLCSRRSMRWAGSNFHCRSGQALIRRSKFPRHRHFFEMRAWEIPEATVNRLSI